MNLPKFLYADNLTHLLLSFNKFIIIYDREFYLSAVYVKSATSINMSTQDLRIAQLLASCAFSQ